MKSTSVNSYPIIAFIRTERTQEGDDCGYIVVQRGPDLDCDFTTAWYHDGSKEWVHGNYGFKKMSEAINDMFERARRHIKSWDEWRLRLDSADKEILNKR